MSATIGNSCARCGVPITPGKVLCEVCNDDATSRTSLIPCIACGVANPSLSSTCEACGAPLHISDGSSRDSSTEIDLSNIGLKGRQAEIQVIQDCFEVCLERGIVGGTIVSGENGMGVSTLLDAFCERLTGRLTDNRIFHVHCRHDQDMFGPIRDVLEQRFKNIADSDPMAGRLVFTNQVGKVLGVDSAALVTETAHLLGYLSNRSFPSSPVLRALEADQELFLRRVKEAIIRFIQADMKNGPIAIVIDGIHKLSSESRAFHIDLFESMGEVPVMLVLGGTKEISKITNNPSVVRVELEPLDDDVMRGLFMDFMPLLSDPPKDLIDMTVDRASGNPGSLRQLCALLTESGVVDTRADAWTVDMSKLTMADMPVNMLDALKARLERLDSRDRSVLRYAALIGEVFWDEVLVALNRQRAKLKENISAAQIWADDSDGLAVSSSLNRLVERQFVVLLPDQDIYGSIKYAFARTGVRDAILSDIPEEERAGLHFLAAEWFAHAATHSGPDFSRMEAEHWELAGENHRGALAYLRAARHARSRYLNQKTIKLFQKALSLSDDRDRLTIVDAYHDLGSVYELVGQYEESEACYTEMLRHAWILIHRGKAGAAMNKIGRLYRARGDSTAARAFLDRGMSLFKAANDEKGVAACLGDLGELARRQGSYDRAFKMVNQSLEIQRKLNNKPSIAVCLQTLGHIEASRASYAQGERYLEEALEIRRQADDKGGMSQTLSALAIVCFNRGDLDRATARWEAALNLAEEVGDRRMLAIVHNNLGEAFRDQGKLDDSMKHFKACEEVVTTLDDRILHAEVSRNLGILSRKMGDLDASKLQLERSLMLAKDVSGKELEALAFRALGELSAETMWDTSNVEGNDDAIDFFDKALTIFKQIGNDYEVARTMHVYGNRLLERGDVGGGKEALEEAKSIFQRIQSKTGDKISRTINDIMAQYPDEQSKKKKPGTVSRLRRAARSEKAKGDEIPDLTDDLESSND